MLAPEVLESITLGAAALRRMGRMGKWRQAVGISWVNYNDLNQGPKPIDDGGCERNHPLLWP